jgi:hypothetical protein
MCKEAVVAYFKLLLQRLAEGTEDSSEPCHSAAPVTLQTCILEVHNSNSGPVDGCSD